MAKRKTLREFINVDDSAPYFPRGNLIEMIEGLQKLLEKVPEESRKTAYIGIEFDDYYGDRIELSYTRDETDEEYDARIKLEEKIRNQLNEKKKKDRAAKKKNEYELYLKLKQKFENKQE